MNDLAAVIAKRAAAHTRSFPTLPEATASYLAGLFDGEGSILIGHTQRGADDHAWTVRAILSSASEDGFFQRLYTECESPGAINTSRPKHRRPVFNWTMSGRALDWFLPSVLPYLRLKRAQADIALSLRDDMRNHSGRTRRLTPRQQAYRELLKLLLDKLHLDSCGSGVSRWSRPGTPAFRKAMQIATDSTRLLNWVLMGEERRQHMRALWQGCHVRFPFYEVAA